MQKEAQRLLHLSLPNSRLSVGEVFGEQELEILLHAQGAHQLSTLEAAC